MHSLRCGVLLPAFVAMTFAAAGRLDAGSPPPAAGVESPPHVDLYGDPLPPGVVARLGTSRFRGSDRYCAVAFSPDGKTMAALGDEAQVSLWDVAAGKQIYREPFQKREGGSRSLPSQFHTVLAFSPDGKSLLVGWDWIGSCRPICLWDVAKRKERLRMEGATNGFRSAVISADFGTLAVADGEGRVRLWDAASGKPLAGWSAPETKAQLVALSADGRTLATGSEDKTVRLWNAASGKQIRAFQARQRPIAALAFSPDGKTLVCEDHAENVVLYGVTEAAGERTWNLAARAVNTSSDYDNGVPFYLMAFSPDGRTLVLWDRDCTPNLWDVASGKRRRAISADPIRACAFSADGKTLAVAGNDFLALYDAVSGAALYPAHDYGVSQVRFSSDGRDVITLAGNKVRRWDAASGRLLRLVWTTPSSVLSADGRTVIGHDWKTAETTVYDTATSERSHSYILEQAGEQMIALSPDQRTLAVGSWQAPEDLKLLDLRAGKPPRRLGSMRLSFDVAAFSPDGRTLAVAGPVPAPPDPNEEKGRNLFGEQKQEEQQCLLWDVASGGLRRQFTVGGDRLRGGGMNFSPDGRLLALRDDRGTVRLWETATGQEVRHWDTKGVAALAFSPDGRTLAASDWPGGPIVPTGKDKGFSQSVSLWDVDSGRKLGWLIGHSPSTLAFSPDGRRLASGSDRDGTALVWDVGAIVHREGPPALRLSSAELTDLWARLGGTDAARAHEAAARLAQAPEDALAFLEVQRAERVSRANAARLTRLIAALDDDAFDRREKAMKDLLEIADLTAPTLRERLKDKALSPEAQQDIRQVLQEMANGKAAPLLQWVRATDVLERVDTPAAWRLLTKLAGASGPAAEEAKATLDRLDQQVPADRPITVTAPEIKVGP